MSIFGATGFHPRCGDCATTLDLAALPAERVVGALYDFREEHRLCGYGVPFGPVHIPAPREASTGS